LSKPRLEFKETAPVWGRLHFHLSKYPHCAMRWNHLYIPGYIMFHRLCIEPASS